MSKNKIFIDTETFPSVTNSRQGPKTLANTLDIRNNHIKISFLTELSERETPRMITRRKGFGSEQTTQKLLKECSQIQLETLPEIGRFTCNQYVKRRQPSIMKLPRDQSAQKFDINNYSVGSDEETENNILSMHNEIQEKQNQILEMKQRDKDILQSNIKSIQHYKGEYRKISFKTFSKHFNNPKKSVNEKSTFKLQITPKNENKIIEQVISANKSIEEEDNNFTPKYQHYINYMSKKLNTIQQDMAQKNITQQDFISKSSLAFKNRKSSLLPKISPTSRKVSEEDEFDQLREWLPDQGPINHIQQNKKLQSKITKIRDINLVYNNYKKGSDLKCIKVFNQEFDMVQRQLTLQKMNKWQDFRAKKMRTINDYVDMRKLIHKKHELTNFFLRQIFLLKIVKKWFSNFDQQRIFNADMRRMQTFYYMNVVKWNSRLRKFGKNKLQDLQKNRIRYAMVFFAQSVLAKNMKTRQKEFAVQQYKKPLKIYFQAMMKWTMKKVMSKKIAFYNDLIEKIQRRFRDKCSTINGKVESIVQYWDQLFFIWFTKASAAQDEGMQKLLLQIKCIQPKVKQFVIKNYIRQCRQVHAAAFFQWRLLFSKNKTDETEENTNSRIEHIETIAADLQQSFYMQHLTVQQGAFWPVKDPAVNYGIIKDQKTVFNIHSFSQIGWPDPFPKPLLEGVYTHDPSITDQQMTQHIDQAIKKNKEALGPDFMYQEKKVNIMRLGTPESDDEDTIKLIYPRDRYTPEHSPMTIYIPTREIMFKMMRACLGCKNVEDLWIFHEDHTKL